MASIPSNEASYQERELRNKITLLETENRELRQRLQWEKRLFSNPHLSASQKLAYWATKPLLEPDKPTHVNITYISKQIGMSPKITGKNLQQIAEANGLIRQVETIITEIGEQQTRVYFAPTEQTARPQLIQPPTPRNHGGARKRCKDCGSENLIEQTIITCMDCGAEQHRTRRSVNICCLEEETANQVDYQEPALDDQETPAPPEPMDNLTSVLQPEKPMDNLTTDIEQPSTPHTQDNQEPEPGQTAVIFLFLDIAGDSAEHIVMNDGSFPNFTKKYKTIHVPLQEQDITAHLAGEKTVGATLSHQDGTTRALCFDTDNEEGLAIFREAARLLSAAGYKPILEISPAGRGGHLWVIFSERVNAQAAYRYVCEIAPELREIREYWPCAANQKVRLPGGKYVTPSFAAWSTILDDTGAEIIKSDLLDYQTPAELVPLVVERLQEVPEIGHKITADTRKTESGIDSHWQQKYSNKNLWFAWTPAQLAEWYNNRTAITDQLPPERNGYGLASWRGERTASVAYTKDGLGWVDFGAGAQKPDGRRDGGDSLELAARLEQKSKSETMRAAARQLLQEARIALENAARSGQQPPAWIIPFMTPEGWSHYEQLRTGVQNGRGVVGFLPEQHNTPEPGKETAAQPAPEPEAENHSPTWYTVGVKRDTTGIPVLCCQCRKPTVWYDGESGYCEAHWREKKQRAGAPIFDL
jgi:hypothetical protein